MKRNSCSTCDILKPAAGQFLGRLNTNCGLISA